jgi:hypothetical protein
VNIGARGSLRDFLVAKFDRQIEVARGEYERCSGDIGSYRAAQAKLNAWIAARGEILNVFKEGEKRDG